MRLEVDVPDRYLLDEGPEEMASLFRRSAALLLFQEGRLSIGSACEFADMDRYAFMEACKHHHILVVDYDPDELEDELLLLNSEA